MRAAVRKSYIRIGTQGFEGSPLDRSVLLPSEAQLDVLEEHPTSRFLPVVGRKVAQEVSKTKNTLAKVAWLCHSDVLSLDAHGSETTAVQTYLLGRHPDGGMRFAAHFMVDEANAIHALSNVAPGSELKSVRSLLMTGSPHDAAMAGHAVALSDWHTVRICIDSC
jgi:hypothetical protein